ncbi:MAG: hypothetical protein ETSY2_29330 [Candidatus Entotheonella gemina]|uniref:non-specific protein-tyrosine kinase n=1 Tax=Candidatus Entotheonella gemina TaxID=1429439 RepID=W4M3Z9_9BACT|nr:MAG: hypothetical protein ETSY2_29330 [Candidatus Entotheonella gemina]
MNFFRKLYQSLAVRAQKILDIHDYVGVCWRRKWLIILPLCLGACMAALYSYTVIPMYRSSSLLIVEGQQISKDYVPTASASNLSERLGILKQQILSRTNLERVIRQFGLHRAQVLNETEPEGWVDQIKSRVKTLLANAGFNVPKPVAVPDPEGIPERVVAQFRDRIEADVVGKRRRRKSSYEAISVSFSGSNPHKVMGITNAIARLFVEENLRKGTQVVEGTTSFLNSQLTVAKQKLEQQEQLLKDFKERHMGALPEQMDANLRKLDRLQAELQSLNEALLKAEEKKLLYQRELREVLSRPAAVVEFNAPPADPRVERLKGLRQQLATLQARFTESYPDIPLLKNQIRELESQLALTPPPAASTTEPSPPVPRVNSLQQQLEGQLRLVQREVAGLKAQQRDIEATRKVYEDRIEQTFSNEQQLNELNREIESTRKNYRELEEKRNKAKLQEELVKRQQGERFDILDPAYLPLAPYKPNRKEMVMFGAILGGAFGFGLAFFLDFLGRDSFRKPDEIQGAFQVPLLASVPVNDVTRRQDQLVTIEEPESIASEQYRVLYTKIERARQATSHKVIAISSAIPSDGKTISSLNLAVVMARDFGKKTMLLEGDFKRPSLSSYLNTKLSGGLVDVLMDGPDGPPTLVPMADTLLPFAHDNLSILPAVKSVRNSSHLLSSRRLQGLLDILKVQYDYILIDTPPVLALSDMNMYREVVDGIILVVRAEVTPKRAVQQTLDMLGTDKVLGFVLNGVQQSFQPYYKYYGAISA